MGVEHVIVLVKTELDWHLPCSVSLCIVVAHPALPNRKELKACSSFKRYQSISRHPPRLVVFTIASIQKPQRTLIIFNMQKLARGSVQTASYDNKSRSLETNARYFLFMQHHSLRV